jgi:hypothetical protein
MNYDDRSNTTGSTKCLQRALRVSAARIGGFGVRL